MGTDRPGLLEGCCPVHAVLFLRGEQDIRVVASQQQCYCRMPTPLARAILWNASATAEFTRLRLCQSDFESTALWH
eukprot:1970508-Amphidinium_carterae.1